ncbi:MAG TPA: transcriptional repressor [Solirubrobacteraceae bacterium]|jgi:Fur family ferric uptake transcriptional regulator
MARPSHVRDAIAQLIADSDRHDWTIEDVAAALHERGVAADPSSVFRGLTRLAAEGTVEKVLLGDGKTRYEAHRAHHEHVVCSDCGAVSGVPGCVLEDAVPAIERATGFRITDHRLLLSGRCGACAGAD